MPRRALRCIVDLELCRVSAPGVWLSMREDCYISISLFGQYRNTRNLTSIFPLCVYEPFRFEKTYYTALDPSDVAAFLEDELVVFELLQYKDYGPGAIRLASYSCSAREFLFPYPSLCPSYSSASRDILLARTAAFPGIAPKLEFSTRTVINESRSPELDALEDALEEEKIARRARSRSRSRSRARSRSRSRTRTISDSLHISITPRSPCMSSSNADQEDCESDPTYMRPTISSVLHSRSKSAVRTSDESLSDTDAGKAPFVVRHLEKSLIGRTPGAPANRAKVPKKTRRSRSLSRPSSALSGYECYVTDDEDEVLVKVIRDSSGRSTPVYTTKYLSDSEDDEVALLTSSVRSLPMPSRPRSASPFIYKPLYSSRYLRSPSPGVYLTASERVELEIARAKARARTRALLRSPSPYRYSPILRDSLEDLALDTSIAQHRRYYPRYL